MATTRYISLAGSDSNTGVLASPFKTWAKAFSVAADGDSLLGRQFDIFRESAVASRNSLTLGSYGGSGNCILAADNVVTGWITSVLPIYKVAMPTQPLLVFVDGIRAIKGASSTSLANGQWFWTGGVLYYRSDAGNPTTRGLLIEASQRNYCIDSNLKTGLIIQSLVARRGQHTANGSVYLHGAGTLDGFDIDDLTVEDSLASGLYLNHTSALGHLTNSVFRRNGQMGAWYAAGLPGYTNQTLDNIQAYENGWDTVIAFAAGIEGPFRSGDIGRLLLYNNGAGGSGDRAHGFYQSLGVDPGLSLKIHDIESYGHTQGYGMKLTGDCTVEDVYVHDNAGGGLNLGPNSGTENTTQTLNRIKVARCAATAGGGIYVDKSSNTGTFTLRAYHITSYHNSTGSSAGELVFASPMASIDVRNSTFTVNGAGSKAIRMVTQSGSVVVDHNDYFNIDTSAFSYGGTQYSFANWKLRPFSPDAHSITLDPKFTNAGASDFTPLVTSPLIDAGVHVSGIDDGYLDAAPDIGAIEVGSGSTAISANVSSTMHGVNSAASVTMTPLTPVSITADVTSHSGGVASALEATVSQAITADVTSDMGGVRSLVDATHAVPITADVTSDMGGVESLALLVTPTPITADVTSDMGGVASALTGGFGLGTSEFGGVAITEAVTAGDPKLYRGFELYVEEPAWIADSDAMVERRVYRLDNPVGRVVERARTPVAKTHLAFAWHMDTRTEIDRFFDFLYMRRGMLEPVWMPSWKHDLWLVNDVASDSNTLTIRTCGYTSRYFAQESRRHLILLDPQNAYVIRRVVAAVDNGNGTETLTLESKTGKAFSVRKTEICFLLLMRQTSDDVEMDQHNIDFYTSVMQFTEVPEDLEINPFGSSPFCITDDFPCGAPLSLAGRGWTITGDAGTDVDWGIGGAIGSGGCAIQYGTTLEQADAGNIQSGSSARKLYGGFAPFAQVRISVSYLLDVVLATTAQFSLSSGSQLRSIPKDTAGALNTIAINSVADADGNVEVTLGISGQSIRNPSGTLILEYLLIVDSLNICTTRILTTSTSDIENPAWAAGYPVAVGPGSMDYRWLAPVEAQEIAIEVADTEFGTYSVIALFGDGAHVPNGEYVDSSFPSGTVKWARVRMLVNDVYLYSDSVEVTYGDDGEVAPTFVDGSPKVVELFAFSTVTRAEWTLGSPANAVNVYAQRLNFPGIVPVLVHTETNPAAILAGTYDVPGAMAFIQLGAVYPDGEIKTDLTVVTP